MDCSDCQSRCLDCTMFQKIVWILGAGFSKPLGGPLLPDLLSAGSWNRIKATYRERKWTEGDAERLVVDLYAEHHGNGNGPAGGRWADAEAFLTFLDMAAEGHGPTRAEFEGMASRLVDRFQGVRPAIREASTAARRLVAAACGAFLVDARLDSEPWLPYQKWAAALGPGASTVVTFNYDLVLESLATKIPSRFEFVSPGPDVVGAPIKAVPVYKLHGSIDWLRVMAGRSAEYRTGRTAEEYLTLDGDQLGIAVPGPNKLARTLELRALWDRAEGAIKEAAAVVFVGYRFPESDAYARERILDALSANDNPYLAIHTVLGPDLSDSASARLRDLVEEAMRQARRRVTPPSQDLNRWEQRGYNIVQHPRWAQDFIGRTTQGHLTQAFLHWPAR